MPVTLRPVIESDLPIFYEQQLDPAATEMADFPSREREPYMAHWHKILADPINIQRTILYNGQVAGNILCFVMDGQREVGYWLGRDYWGKGIATEALRQLLQEIPERPLCAHIAKHNIASRRVLEKCSFMLRAPQRGDAADEFVLVLEP
jgi:RimJ/RimL family protein N-acetyltransferase